MMRQFSKQSSAFTPAEQMPTVQIHQIMKSKEEFEALKQQRDTRQQRQPAERSACLMASCPSTCLHGEPASAFGLQECNAELLLGTLDLYAVKAMPGEVLIGEQNAFRCLRVLQMPCRGMQMVHITLGSLRAIPQ